MMSRQTKARLSQLITVAMGGALGLLALAAVDARHIGASADTGRTIDAITFGRPGSEAKHHLRATASTCINGGLGEPARLLLPLHPAQIYGGNVQFTMRCTPRGANYITVQYWGSDRGEAMGRLLLYCNKQQVGYRFMSDYGLISGAENAGSEAPVDSRPFPGRFFYVTEPLPLRMTRGQHQVHLELQALGYDFMYASNFRQYQHMLRRPSRGIYRAWITTKPYFVPPPNDRQGAAPPPPPVRPAPGPRMISEAKSHVNHFISSLLRGRAYDGPQRLEVLARAYSVPWCVAYHNKTVVRRVVRDIDALARGKRNHNEANISWRLFGPVGRAVALLYAQVKPILDQTIRGPHGQSMPRRRAWAELLTKTIAYEETHQRYYTNQAMIVNSNIYTANQGLELLEPGKAMSEKKARWYLYEAIGLVPFRGNKLPDGHWQWPFGHHYHLVTRKGLSRELGYVASYGETIINLLWEMDVETHHDPRINQQVMKMLGARSYFMAPGVDRNGYRAMRLEGVIGWRHNLYPEEVCYGARTVGGHALECADLFGRRDQAAVGWAQQCLADNQFFQSITPLLSSTAHFDIHALLLIPGQYSRVQRMARAHIMLPMTPGQPDFTWADPQDGVVVIKHNHTRLYASLYYRAYDGINQLARIHCTTSTVDRLVRCYEHVRFTPSGKYYVRPDDIDQLQFHGRPPPGNTIHEAYAGQKLPIPKLPRGYVTTKGHNGPFARGHYGPYLGRAAFYRLRYGHFLIGMNSGGHKSYPLRLPKDAGSVRNLATGKMVSRRAPLQVGPRQTVMLYVRH